MPKQHFPLIRHSVVSVNLLTYHSTDLLLSLIHIYHVGGLAVVILAYDTPLGVANVLRIELVNVRAVSYTHLDVYKRQLLDQCKGTRFLLLIIPGLFQVRRIF